MPALRAFPFLGLLVLLATVSCSQDVPKARAGLLDLTNWDFSHRGLARLDGQWDIYWGAEVLGPEPAPSAPGGTIAVPGFWSSTGDALFPGQGSATYHLHVRLPPGDQWSLLIPDVSCTWKLTVNGVPAGASGTASVDPRQYKALVRPVVVDLPTLGGEADMYLYVVNFDDHSGGIRDSILVGPSTTVKRQERATELGSAVLLGGVVVMALFNVIIFSWQRQKWANLWLAVFALSVAGRASLSGSRMVYDWWPTLSFELSAQMEYFCVLLAFVSFTVYLRTLFREVWPSRIFIPFLLYTALFVLLEFILPIKTYSEAFADLYEPPLLVAILVLAGVSWWAAQKRHKDGLWVLGALVFLMVGALNDLILEFVPLPEGSILEPCLFLFLVFHTFLLSRQLSKDYVLTQKQSGDLRKLDKMKDEFLARVTHELRTPLHGMIGILDAFRMGDFGSMSHRQAYHLSLLESSSKRLLTMVNSILDFSQLKKPREGNEPKPILVKQMVDFLLPSFYPGLKPGIALVNRVSDQVPAALGDEVKLEQVLQHLLRNALQHTDSGTIAVEAEIENQQILISIRDTGSGIPAEKLAQLFTPFHQVNEVDTRATGGLGLGLAISRQLVQHMGGRLDLHSREGSGTTVTIALPVCPPARLHYYQAQRLDRVFRGEPETVEGPVPESLPPQETSEFRPTVLIVDDEPVNLLVLRTFLHRIGYSILEAPSGAVALQTLETHVVDLVILDIMMPGMSGYEVCTRIRDRFTPARLPVLLLTAKNQVEDLLQGYRCGASDFLTKPFQRDELRARMELHLKVSRAARTGMVVANKG